jgi:predicted dithiol-disulfide oxidoreductase (DUF899 family)
MHPASKARRRMKGGKPMADLKNHPVVSRADWLAARTSFLAKEKEFTKLRDELNRQRRALPWVKVEKPYAFDAIGGRKTLPDLFGKKSQLIVYHFMFSPDWNEGCPHCSFWADHYSGVGAHLGQRDATLVAVSRAPLSKIEAFRKRMGWSFPWVSSAGSDFNYDFGVSWKPEELSSGPIVYNYKSEKMEMQDREGASVFYKDAGGTVYHTYSCYARGIDLLNGTYNFLDLTPRGRDEESLEFTQAWVRHHDRYEE